MSDQLSSRISSGLACVKSWDEDPILLAEVRKSIPLDKLMPPSDRGVVVGGDINDDSGVASLFPRRIFASDANNNNNNDDTVVSPYARDDDINYESDDLLLKRLTLYFKLEVMSWVNNPCCSVCGDANTTGCGMRGPTTDEETQGGAGRVELYSCSKCDSQTTTFPRYNSARKLFETRQGRCGEYANLFGLYCRSLGFETRYISDFTDHVWVEVWSDRRGTWLHADSCEGKIDEPSMYEHGWGKKLNYILAFSNEGGGQVADVTGRYTRKLLSDDFQARRREITVSESQGEITIAQVNASIRSRSSLSKARQDELDRRASEEKKFFHLAQQSGAWDAGAYKEGRISGSLAWRAARDELGEDGSEGKGGDAEDSDPQQQRMEKFFHVESFHPRFGDNNVSITVATAQSSPSSLPCRDTIVVSGVACAVGLPKSISIVIVDELSGCILQSRSFGDWDGAAAFLHAVPDDRIVAVYADAVEKISPESSVQNKLSRLGGFDCSAVSDEVSDGENQQLVFIGQMNIQPGWAICRKATSELAVNVTIELPTSSACSKLRVERDTAPQCISCRLPEEVMPLATQLLASESQKRRAFLKFVEDKKALNKSVVTGYSTKEGAPIYLLSTTAFPFQRCKSEGALGKGWGTHHYLPEPLVPEKDEYCEDATTSLAPAFDIPTDTDFFRNLFGTTLLSKDSSGNITSIDTETALHNSRLVALYFSAHWCGPCRRFTPMLCEFYETLKEALSSHGLEIVFVSSDRDPNGFNEYYGSMPWLSLPFDKRSLKQSISMRYGVRGIPALVVLDSITGAVVVSADQSRSEVAMACQGGDDSITNLVTESWLKRIPPESQSIMESLSLSCLDAGDGGDGETEVDNSFLLRNVVDIEKEDEKTSAVDPSERIKTIFSELVSGGMEANAAAAKAITMVGEEQAQPKVVQRHLSAGELHAVPWTCTVCIPTASTYKPDSNEWSEQILKDVRVHQRHSSNGGAVADGSLRASDSDKAVLRQVVLTAKKYLDNVQKEPFTSKFRRFKLSNKVFDQIVRVPGGIDQIMKLGFAIYCTDTDYMASIPLATDLEAMQEATNKLLRIWR